MPAVTVDDILTLPRVPEPDAAIAAERPVVSVTTAPTGFEGEGFPVRRAFAGVDLAQLDPFIHMDQMGEVEYAPGEPKGTPWHPHRGFETVTYMIDGMFHHQDSNGGGGLITNGDTQWMTAGGGILHIEAPAGGAGRSAAGCSTASSCGSTCPGALKMTRPALPGHPRPAGGAAVLRRRRRAGPGHRRRRSPGTPARASPTPRSRLVHATAAARRASSTCPGAATSTRWSTCCPATARSAPSAARSRTGQLAVLRRRRRASPCGADAAAQDSRSPSLDVLRPRRAARSASRSPRTARS